MNSENKNKKNSDWNCTCKKIVKNNSDLWVGKIPGKYNCTNIEKKRSYWNSAGLCLVTRTPFFHYLFHYCFSRYTFSTMCFTIFFPGTFFTFFFTMFFTIFFRVHFFHIFFHYFFPGTRFSHFFHYFFSGYIFFTIFSRYIFFSDFKRIKKKCTLTRKTVKISKKNVLSS